VIARRYLDNAFGYLEIQSPRLIAVGGLSGSDRHQIHQEIVQDRKASDPDKGRRQASNQDAANQIQANSQGV